jgi:hypothetical protein
MTGTSRSNGVTGAAAVPEAILELAEGCRGFVAQAVGVELDFTPETLPILDHYLAMARGGIDQRPEVLELVLRSAGAYFGEVLRRTLDGFWCRSDADVHLWQLGLRRAYLALNPAGIVREVLARGADLAGPDAALHLDRDDRTAVEQRLAALPAVSEEEYYLLSTRFEALEVMYEALRDKMQAEGIAAVELGVEDYTDAPDA